MGVFRAGAVGMVAVAVAAVVWAGAGTAVAAVAVADESCRSLPAPAAGALGADDALTRFGVDGEGVRVGVISGSFATRGADAVAADVAAGLLPGPGNPCGYENAVAVVRENPGDDDDEGRAMAQVVHGIAPGAQILFASDSGGFPDAVDLLVAQGASVIVDDVQGGEDRRYRAGAGEQAIQRAVDAGVFYVTAAGNYGVPGAAGYPSEGFPIGAWATDQYRPTTCPQNVADLYPGEQIDCQDFDPGSGADATLEVTLPAGSVMIGSLDWAEPDGGVSTELDYVVSVPGRTVKFTASDPNRASLSTPLQNPSTTDVGDDQVSIVRKVTASAATPALAVTWQQIPGSSVMLDQEYFRSTGTDTVGATLFGHQAYPAAFSVAAVDVTDSTLETYSSLGPATILFGVPAPLTVAGPVAAGVDDLPVSSTVLNGTGSFRGTSAAAPTVAASAALIRQYRPALSPDQVRAALTGTARLDAITSPWDPSVTAERSMGAGLIDVGAALQELADVTPPSPTPTTPPAPADQARPAQPALAATGQSVAGLPALAVAGVLSAFAGAVLLTRIAPARRRARR